MPTGLFYTYFTSTCSVISSPSSSRTRHERWLLRPRNDRVLCWAGAGGGAAASSVVVVRPPSSKSTDRFSLAGGGGWSVGSSRTDDTSRLCWDHCWRRRRHSAWFFSIFIDAGGGTPARRRPVLGDSVTGDRADRPPLRDGIVDQLAVVTSSGVRRSDRASLASVGTSCKTQTSRTSYTRTNQTRTSYLAGHRRHTFHWPLPLPFLLPLLLSSSLLLPFLSSPLPPPPP